MCAHRRQTPRFRSEHFPAVYFDRRLPPGLISPSRSLPVCLDKKLSASLGGRRLSPFITIDVFCPLRSGVTSQKGMVDESIDYEDRDWRDVVAPPAGETARGGLHLRRRRVDYV